MEFETEKLKVTINKKDYFIDYPTVEFIQKNIKEAQEAGEEEVDGIEQSILKLDFLGLPKEVSRKLKPSQFKQIADKIFEADLEKKN